MFVRVIRTSVASDRQGPGWEQEATRHTERTIAYMRQQPGFRRYLAALDPASMKGIVITEWETQEQAEQFTQRPDLAQEVGALGVQLDSVDILEVRTVAEQAQLVA